MVMLRDELKKYAHGREHKIHFIGQNHPRIHTFGNDPKMYTEIVGRGAVMIDRSRELVDSAILCVKDAARLLFNYLRLSSNYWLVCTSPVSPRLHKHMPDDQRAAVECFRRYGSVFDVDFEKWERRTRRLFANNYKSTAGLYLGTETAQIAPADHFVHLPQDSALPTTRQWMAILSDLRQSRQARVQAGRARVRARSLWKILHLIYTRAQHPDLDQWRVGAMVNLVKADRVGQQVDPWAARSKRGVEHIRRTLNILVRRLLDRGAVIAENASRNLFPSDEGRISDQMRFNFDDGNFKARLLLPHGREAEYIRSRLSVV